MLNLTKTRPTTITIDGQVIGIHVQRMTVDQAEDFARRFQWLFACHTRQVEAMKRIKDMTEDEATAEKERQAREDAENSAFAADAIASYVTVDPQQLSIDGLMVTTGAQLLAVIGTDSSLVIDVMSGISSGQTMSERLRKASASESASAPSSDVHEPAQAGPTLAPIVGPVVNVDATRTVGATAETGSRSSGSMATLS
jgi:hypothetical protein